MEWEQRGQQVCYIYKLEEYVGQKERGEYLV